MQQNAKYRMIRVIVIAPREAAESRGLMLLQGRSPAGAGQAEESCRIGTHNGGCNEEEDGGSHRHSGDLDRRRRAAAAGARAGTRRAVGGHTGADRLVLLQSEVGLPGRGRLALQTQSLTG